jgi:hypothetical protein
MIKKTIVEEREIMVEVPEIIVLKQFSRKIPGTRELRSF